MSRSGFLVAGAFLLGCSLDAAGRADDPGSLADSEIDSTTAETSIPDDSAVTESDPIESGEPLDTSVPDTLVADTFVADTFMPDTSVVDTLVVDTSVPDTFVADTFVPDTFVADTFVPDTFVPPDTAMDAGPPPCTEANSGIFNGRCYFVVTTVRNWNEARDACIAAGTPGHPAHLATLGTDGEWNFVNNLPGGGSNPRWIGLRATSPSNKKSDFAWVGGDSSTIDKWLPMHPDNSGSCVEQHSKGFSPSGGWEDVNCTWDLAYVCERE